MKLKFVAKVVLGKMLCNENKQSYTYEHYLKSKNIQWLSADTTSVEKMYFSDSEKKLYKVQKDDLLVSEGGEVGKTCIWNNELAECYLQNSVHKVTFDKNHNPRYFLYLFFVYGQVGGFDSSVSRVSIAHLTWDILINIKFIVPPLDEQRRIAEFLDSKCAKIAEFIDKKQQIISLLKEQKLALINESTCGRIHTHNDNQTHLKFKHSGIEWLGEIPQHWEIRKLKQIGVFNKGNNITKKYISDEGLPFIVYGDIYTKYNFKALNIAHKISSENANLATLVGKNTLLFSASGEIIEDIGKCVVLLADYAYIGGDVITLNTKNCDSVFLSYAINSAFAIYQKATMGKGDIIVHIHILNLKNLQIPLPPLDEQRQIAEFLDKKCEKIDKAIALIEQEIQAIKEYKTSLIDKAVRGQI